MKTEIVVPNPDRVIICLDANSPSGEIEFVPAIKKVSEEGVDCFRQVGPNQWIVEPLVRIYPIEISPAMVSLLVGSD